MVAQRLRAVPRCLGSDLEYADEVTLTRALEGREEIQLLRVPGVATRNRDGCTAPRPFCVSPLSPEQTYLVCLFIRRPCSIIWTKCEDFSARLP